jgi:ubiquinone/menaquinone biosynthesis C-methylase UbiE
MRRVLAPGGRLLLIDHVESTSGLLRLAQTALEAVTTRTAGEYFTRRQLPLVEASGFRVVESRRRIAGIIEYVHAQKVA